MSSAWRVLLVVVALTAANGQSSVSIVSRKDWHARPPSGEMTPMSLPLGRAVIAHTAGRGCTDDQSCAEQVAGIQTYQMVRLKYSDISYHYLVGGNGRVYEARSPSQQGAIAAGNNANSLAIAFIGNFDLEPPTDAALAAAQSLLEHAVSQGELAQSYQLLGHRQLSATKSPGDALYTVIRNWPQWSSTGDGT
ncbi:peptidoglycan-recognition protein SD [Drosophila hydei]|uniref:Peptidoglycan-recognition protein SD n=1 Tax=Drosophila hydei TaxID=7224 RepID=A0A6J1LIM7_DROHY|nr:peptidoglycan-recognition protein SD [Drosophila hydei]